MKTPQPHEVLIQAGRWYWCITEHAIEGLAVVYRRWPLEARQETHEAQKNRLNELIAQYAHLEQPPLEPSAEMCALLTSLRALELAKHQPVLH